MDGITKNKRTTSTSKDRNKPRHNKPTITKIGSLKDLSQTLSTGVGNDHGSFPKNKRKN